MRPVIEPVRTLRRRAALDDRVGAQDLAAPRGRHDARGQVHLGPEVVARALLRGATMQAHAHAQAARETRPRFRVQRNLRVDRGGNRILDARERGAEAVARDREHVSVARVDRRAEQVVVTAECGLHRRRVLGPHSGRTLDVGEEERHQPGRPNPHTRSLT